MPYKTILVHCGTGGMTANRAAAAAELAQRFGAHLVGVHVAAPFEAPMAMEGAVAIDVLYAAHQERVKADEVVAAAAFNRGIAGKGLSPEWRTATGPADRELAVQARYADLIVLGQHDPGDRARTVPANLPESVALSTGRPVLVMPYIDQPTPQGKNILLCWNASREAARAAADAMPFLAAAEKVVVLVIDAKPSSQGHGDEPGADVASWLARHGVRVTVQRDTAADADVGNVILSRAADMDTDLIVMGVYGHSRLREMVMGGASRTLLSSMTVPVFMAH